MSNLALNKSATAIGSVAPFTAAKAVDGSLTPLNRWLCEAMPCWMAVDLGDTYWIDKWVVKHMGVGGWSSPNYNMKNYKLQGSMNNSTWVDLDTVANNTASTTDRSFTPAQARYVRVYVSTGLNINQGVASIVELEVYESAYDPYLAGLSISSGTLNPAFGRKTFSYTDLVGSDVTFVTVTPTAEAPNAVIKVKDAVVTSGTPSQQIVLQSGENSVPVVVTNGPIVQKYTITVTQQSNATYLSNLVLNGPRGALPLTPAFKSDTIDYTASVSVASVTVTPTAEQTSSTIKVNNIVVTSGQPSQSISLNQGINTITIQVTPEGGGSPTTYTINVTK